jgi:hypothetical protein
MLGKCCILRWVGAAPLNWDGLTPFTKITILCGCNIIFTVSHENWFSLLYGYVRATLCVLFTLICNFERFVGKLSGDVMSLVRNLHLDRNY